MKVKVIKQPYSEPVYLDDAKNHLRVDDPYEDSTISALITAAREFAEAYTARKFIKTEVQASLKPVNNGDSITLPYGDDIEIVSVKVGGVDVSKDKYTVEDNVIKFKSKFSFVKVNYTAGYGDNSESVPASIKQAILMLLGALYEQRSDLTFNLNVQTSPITSLFLLNPHRLF